MAKAAKSKSTSAVSVRKDKGKVSRPEFTQKLKVPN
jgi:hypothetical protein